MHQRFHVIMSAAAFVAGIALTPVARAQVAPAPGTLVGANAGSIRSAPGVPTLGLNIGETQVQEGHAATITVLGPNSIVDANFANVTTAERTQLADVAAVGAGPVAVTRPNDGGSAVALALAGSSRATAHTLGVAVAAPGAPANATLGGRSIGGSGWSGLPGLDLPFLKPGQR